MTEIAFHILTVYIFLFAVGFPAHSVLTPSCMKEKGTSLWLAPFYGMIILTQISAYIFCFNAPIAYALPLSIGVSVALACWIMIFRKPAALTLLAEIKSDIAGIKILYAAAIVAAAAALLAPALKAGMDTCPFHFGPDFAQYTGMAQYLMDGGTYAGAFDIRNPANTGSAVLYDSFIIMFRWGVSFLLAAFAALTGEKHAYRAAFPLVACIYLYIGYFSYKIMRRFADLTEKQAFWFAGAIVFNGNLITVLYESFWAQIFAMPALLYLFFLMLDSRSPSGGEESGKKTICGILAVAFLFIIYSEAAVCLIPATIGAVCFFDVVTNRRLSGKFLIYTATTYAGAALVIFPCLPSLYISVMNSMHLIDSGAGAWRQPLWAWPSEILGITSIYGKMNALSIPLEYNAELKRSASDIIINAALSLAAAAVYIRAVVLNRKIDRAFFMVPAAAVLTVFATLQIKHQHSYLYLKMYTIMLPLLVAGTAAVFAFDWRRASAWKNRALCIFTAAVIASGAMTIFKYSRNYGTITKELEQLHDFIGRNELLPGAKFRDSVFIYIRTGGNSQRLPHPDANLMMNIMRVNWLNMLAVRSDDDIGIFTPYRAVFLVDKNGGRAPSASGNRLFENARFTVIDSGRMLSSFVAADPDGRKRIDFTSEFN